MRVEYYIFLSMGTILMFVTYAVNILDYYLSVLSGISFLLAIVSLLLGMIWFFLLGVLMGVIFIISARIYQNLYDH
jgi:hypothetical protein